ncbi:MAG: hypothetical protein WCH59_13140, partial [Chitinophagia bacterium]
SFVPQRLHEEEILRTLESDFAPGEQHFKLGVIIPKRAVLYSSATALRRKAIPIPPVLFLPHQPLPLHTEF